MPQRGKPGEDRGAGTESRKGTLLYRRDGQSETGSRGGGEAPGPSRVCRRRDNFRLLRRKPGSTPRGRRAARMERSHRRTQDMGIRSPGMGRGWGAPAIRCNGPAAGRRQSCSWGEGTFVPRFFSRIRRREPKSSGGPGYSEDLGMSGGRQIQMKGKSTLQVETEPGNGDPPEETRMGLNPGAIRHIIGGRTGRKTWAGGAYPGERGDRYGRHRQTQGSGQDRLLL